MSKNPSSAGYVGFSNLPNQAHRRMVKRGFEFTLMLVGESGLGKSTLVSALFHINKDYNGNNLNHATKNDFEEKINQTVKITPSEVQIEDKGVKLKLTIVDTPGFGESLTGVDQQEPISKYIDQQFQQYLDDETGINRRNIADSRVHCCFYFISPHSNGLRPMDVNFMKQLHHKVNIVPLIAKADTGFGGSNKLFSLKKISKMIFFETFLSPPCHSNPRRNPPQKTKNPRRHQPRTNPHLPITRFRRRRRPSLQSPTSRLQKRLPLRCRRLHRNF